MNNSVLIACSWSVTATYWASTLQKTYFVTHICHTNLPDALRLVDQHRPNLLLAEAGFDNGLGLELARQAVMRYPAIRCVLFLPLTNEAWTKAMQADISGYLPDGLSDEIEIMHCLDEIRQGRRYTSPAFRNLTLLPSPEVLALLNGLSERQKQILRLLAKSQTARQISFEVDLTESGVNDQKEKIWHKLGLKGANELKCFAGSVQAYL